MTEVKVNVPGGRYDILIGRGILSDAGELIKKVTGTCSAAVITDDTVDSLYSARLEAAMASAGFKTVKYVFPHGEKSKNAETYLSILNFLAENRLTRSDIIVALGGGVTGDMAGFAAATYLRGIRLIQIPTTLLAAVDSSVGGKTAIDLPAGKNLVGSFYQPSLVICDPDVLATLPDSVFGEGCAEIIKYGIICDRELFVALKAPIKEQLERIISRCVEIKRDIVMQDERDTGIRQILNFGHTFGHGVEKQSRYTVSHGDAVAAGMAIITKACFKSGICQKNCYDELIKILESYRLPTKTEYTAEEIFDAVLSDKKRTSGNITLVLPKEIGRCVLEKMPVEQAYELLKIGLDSK